MGETLDWLEENMSGSNLEDFSDVPDYDEDPKHKQIHLTIQERSVTMLRASGKTREEIAEALGVSVTRVAVIIRNIRRKLRIASEK